MSDFKDTLETLASFVLIPLYILASPLTFVWLVYSAAQYNHTFVEWIGIIIGSSLLASIWPLYWLFELIKFIFS